MSEATINLLAQIPLAGVIVLVIIIFLKFIGTLVTDNRDAITTNAALLAATIKQNQDSANNVSISFVKQLESVAEKLANINDCLIKHDEFVRMHGDIQKLK